MFLVDTQGLFDLEASIEKITVIGTLSIAISSLQCFNVKTQIDRIHLEYIYVSILYESASLRCDIIAIGAKVLGFDLWADQIGLSTDSDLQTLERVFL